MGGWIIHTNPRIWPPGVGPVPRGGPNKPKQNRGNPKRRKGKGKQRRRKRDSHGTAEGRVSDIARLAEGRPWCEQHQSYCLAGNCSTVDKPRPTKGSTSGQSDPKHTRPPRKTARKCTPHRWVTPSVGSRGLTCERCGRHMDFLHDLHPNTRTAIIASYRRRNGNRAAARFVEAVADAITAYRAAHNQEECGSCTDRESPIALKDSKRRRVVRRQQGHLAPKKKITKGSRRRGVAEQGRYFDWHKM